MQKEGDSAGSDNLLQIIQETDSPNPNDHTFCVKMNLPKQPVMKIINIYYHYKKEQQRKIDEKFGNLQSQRPKLDQYRRLDDRAKEQHKRRQTELYKAYYQFEQHANAREKYGFALFEPFTNRGKNPNIKFSHQKIKANNNTQNILCIRFNKKYYLQELKLPRSYLLSIPASFVSIWEHDFIGMVKIFMKILAENWQKGSANIQKGFYNVYLRSLDLISFTFDVIYGDKKVYRFRYSPYEFRSSAFIKQDHQLVGYNQCISVLSQVNPKNVISDSDFYIAPRCFIFDDLTDSNMFAKILQRTNIFYIAYSISRGEWPSSGGADQFSKKCLWQFYFSTTRLKKFIFTWSFRPFRRVVNRSQLLVKDIQLESKDIILHIPFYVEIREMLDDYHYRIRVQYHDFSRNMPFFVKEEIIHRVRQWYSTYKQQLGWFREKDKMVSQQERIQQAKINDRQRMNDPKYERFREKPDREENELEMYFGNRDRFDRFLIGMLVIVSTVIDRNYFSMLDEKAAKIGEDSKVAILDTPELVYVNKKHQHMRHFHWVEIHLENKILPYLFRQEREKTNLKQNESKIIKCGQWRLVKMYKWKREWNLKTQKPGGQPKFQEIMSFSDIFKDYIEILLKHFSLKFIYKDVINFVSGIAKNCYQGWEESNSFEMVAIKQSIFRPIIASILNIYYYAPLAHYKERQQKRLQKLNPEKEKQAADRQQQQRSAQEQRLRREDRLNDQFYRVVVIKILTRGDPGFMYEDRLLAEVTFRVMEYRSCWITRMKDGIVMIRIFDDRIDFQRQYEKVDTLKFNAKNKNAVFEDDQFKQKLQKLDSEIKTTVLS